MPNSILFERHLGRSKCKERACQLMFQPKMLGDVHSFVAERLTCKKLAYQQPHEPLMMHKVPPYPWFRVGIDSFGYGGNSYFVAFHGYRNCPEVENLHGCHPNVVLLVRKAWHAGRGLHR